MDQPIETAVPASPARSALVRVLPSPEIRQELGGIALLAGAAFVAGALMMAGRGSAPHCWNAATKFGPAGACARSAAFFLVGPLAAAMLPIVLAAMGASRLRLLSRETARRTIAFAASLALILAVAATLVATGRVEPAATTRAGGILGAWGAAGLTRLVGIAGAWLGLLALLYGSARLTVWRRGTRPRLPGWVRRLRAPRRDAGPAAAPAPVRKPFDWTTHAAAFVALPPAPTDAALENLELDPKPPVDLLLPTLALAAGSTPSERETTEYRLIGALRSLKIDATVVGRTAGPRVTRYDIEISPSTPVSDSAALARNIATLLKVPAVRLAPLAGTVALGVEIPHASPSAVTARELIDSAEYRDAGRMLPLVIGRDTAGAPVVADLARMPNLLLAGNGDSGKTACLSAMITSLVYRHSERTLRMLLIDADDAGLSVHDGLPHVWGRVVTDYAAAAPALARAVLEMRARYDLLAATGARNLGELNQRGRRWFDESGAAAGACRPLMTLEDRACDGAPLPFLVIALDDLADLIRAGGEAVEKPLQQLASRGRAVGIHLVAATQRPLPGRLSRAFLASFAGRVALRVSDAAESRAIIERAGAETLLGAGDLLFLAPGKNEPTRVQAPLVAADDTRRIVRWYQGPRDETPIDIATPQADAIQATCAVQATTPVVGEPRRATSAA